MNFIQTTTLLISLSVPTAPLFAEEAPRIIVQDNASEDSCGPSSIANWLLNGTSSMKKAFDAFPGGDDESKMLHLIKAYASKPSAAYKKVKRARYKNDTQPTDLRMIVEDFLADHPNLTVKVEGKSLQRSETESIPSHLKSIHKRFKTSLDLGIPIIAHFRAYRTYNDGDDGEQMWGFSNGHYVVITEIQAELRNKQAGFTFKYVDSAGAGSVGHGYIHVSHRDFQAKVFDGDLPPPGQGWHRDRPFLLVTAPSLQLGQGTHWWYRQLTILNYAVYGVGS